MLLGKGYAEKDIPQRQITKKDAAIPPFGISRFIAQTKNVYSKIYKSLEVYGISR